jgi:hypothetical protein
LLRTGLAKNKKKTEKREKKKKEKKGENRKRKERIAKQSCNTRPVTIAEFFFR